MFQNPLLKNDIAHQQDLIFFQIENGPRSFRSLIKKFQFLTKEKNERDNSTYLNFREKRKSKRKSTSISLVDSIQMFLNANIDISGTK
jgi:hypothetical protein